jgi:hypothetical protein
MSDPMRNQFPSVLLQRSHICPRQCLWPPAPRARDGRVLNSKVRTRHGTQRFRRRCTSFASPGRIVEKYWRQSNAASGN